MKKQTEHTPERKTCLNNDINSFSIIYIRTTIYNFKTNKRWRNFEIKHIKVIGHFRRR